MSYRSPWMNEDLEIFRDSVRKFFEAEVVPHGERWIQAGMVDRALWNKAGEWGVLCAAIPEQYGGGGGTFAHEAVIYTQEIATGAVSFGMAVHSGIVAHYVLSYGTEAQKMRWLPRLATGEMVGAICMTEPGTGSDLQAIQTRAKRAGDVYVLNGQKTFVTNGQHANLLCVVTRTGDEKGARGVSLLMVETELAEGFSRGRNLHKLGLESHDTSELFFEDVRVPAHHMLGEQTGRGFAQLMQQLPWERLIIAISAVAAMERAIALTQAYVKERKAFGKRILDFQNTRFTLAECQTEATIARVFVDQCMMELLAGTLTVERAAMAKWWTTQKQCEIVDECLQLHGGYGLMLEYPIARLYADSRVQKIYGGTNEIMKELIARSLDDPRKTRTEK